MLTSGPLPQAPSIWGASPQRSRKTCIDSGLGVSKKIRGHFVKKYQNIDSGLGISKKICGHFVKKCQNLDSGSGISKKMRTFCKKMSIADLVYAFDATSC